MSGQLTNGTIKLAMFNDMRKRYNNYVAKNNSLPNKIATISGGNSYITLPYFDVMVANKDKFVSYYKKEPASIKITRTPITYPLKPTPTPIVNTFNIGYFINPSATPLNTIDFVSLKNKGITEVYIRIFNDNYNNSTFNTYLTKIKAAGLKPYAWTWQGFKYTKYLADKGWNICCDIENYNMAAYYNEIIKMRNDCKNRTFIICTKPQDWDDDQKWSIISGYCDYLMPMLYLGDYGKTIENLAAYMKSYNTKYPGKIYPALETYISDANVTAKSKVSLKSEIEACKPYCKGVALFRYGISNY